MDKKVHQIGWFEFAGVKNYQPVLLSILLTSAASFQSACQQIEAFSYSVETRSLRNLHGANHQQPKHARYLADQAYLQIPEESAKSECLEAEKQIGQRWIAIR